MHQHPTARPANTSPARPLNKVVNRPPVTGGHVAHLNRGREVGTRRTDDIRALQARTARED